MHPQAVPALCGGLARVKEAAAPARQHCARRQCAARRRGPACGCRSRFHHPLQLDAPQVVAAAQQAHASAVADPPFSGHVRTSGRRQSSILPSRMFAAYISLDVALVLSLSLQHPNLDFRLVAAGCRGSAWTSGCWTHNVRPSPAGAEFLHFVHNSVLRSPTSCFCRLPGERARLRVLARRAAALSVRLPSNAFASTLQRLHFPP